MFSYPIGNSFNNLVTYTVLAVIITGTNISNAQDFYVGANIGSVELGDSVFEGSNTIPAVYGGWNFSKFFGIELAYSDFDEFATGVAHKQDTKGLSVYGRAMLPISEYLSVFGKIGQLYWHNDITRIQDGYSVSDSDHDAAYGMGLDYQMTEFFDLRLGYDIFEINLGYSPIGPFFMDIDGEFELWSLGLHFRF